MAMKADKFLGLLRDIRNQFEFLSNEENYFIGDDCDFNDALVEDAENYYKKIDEAIKLIEQTMSMTKKELAEYCADDFEKKFNVTAIHFYPFSYWKSFENKRDERQALKGLRYSTVYKGNRFCFDNPDDLKKFCETVENLEN